MAFAATNYAERHQHSSNDTTKMSVVSAYAKDEKKFLNPTHLGHQNELRASVNTCKNKNMWFLSHKNCTKILMPVQIERSALAIASDIFLSGKSGHKLSNPNTSSWHQLSMLEIHSWLICYIRRSWRISRPALYFILYTHKQKKQYFTKWGAGNPTHLWGQLEDTKQTSCHWSESKCLVIQYDRMKAGETSKGAW